MYSQTAQQPNYGGYPTYPPQGPTYSGHPVQGQPVMEPYGYGKPTPYAPQVVQPQEYYAQPQQGVYSPSQPNLVAPSGDKFEAAPTRYNDVWAALLWICSVLVVIGFGLYALSQSPHERLETDMSYGKISGYVAASVGISLLLAVPLHYFMNNHSEALIYFGNITYIVLLALLTVYLFAVGVIVAAVISLLFALLYAWWFAMVRHRIPFAAMCMKTSAGVVNTYKATILNAAVWMISTMLFTMLWAFGVYSKAGLDAKSPILWVWLLFFYWSVQVFTNIIHVTTCGVVAMWYFCGSGAMPHNPTLGAVRRATTYSLGSICFGSLIVAALKVFRAMVQQAMRGENEFVRCIVMCILDCIEGMMRYFNEYAYVQVAVYGKSYVQAAKDTWELIKTSGITAIINDQLLQIVFFMFVVGGGLIVGAIMFFVSRTWVFFVIGTFIGMTVISMLAGLVQSGVQTIFVCFAEEPVALQRSNPALYAAMNNAMAGNSEHDQRV